MSIRTLWEGQVTKATQEGKAVSKTIEKQMDKLHGLLGQRDELEEKSKGMGKKLKELLDEKAKIEQQISALKEEGEQNTTAIQVVQNKITQSGEEIKVNQKEINDVLVKTISKLDWTKLKHQSDVWVAARMLSHDLIMTHPELHEFQETYAKVMVCVVNLREDLAAPDIDTRIAAVEHILKIFKAQPNAKESLLSVVQRLDIIPSWSKKRGFSVLPDEFDIFVEEESNRQVPGMTYIKYLPEWVAQTDAGKTWLLRAFADKNPRHLRRLQNELNYGSCDVELWQTFVPGSGEHALLAGTKEGQWLLQQTATGRKVAQKLEKLPSSPVKKGKKRRAEEEEEEKAPVLSNGCGKEVKSTEKEVKRGRTFAVG